MITDIKDRTDINKLVCTFYHEIKKDELLGPIFNKMISSESWEIHIKKLTDFWETNLFGVPKFKGNPTQKHLNTDAAFNHIITQKHFDHWLSIWTKTIDSLYQGDLATRAKSAAYSIAHIQNIVMARNKPKTKENSQL